MAENADDILRDIRHDRYTQHLEIGATAMIEALKADRLIPEDIDNVKARSEAIRRLHDPMSTPIPIGDMRED